MTSLTMFTITFPPPFPLPSACLLTIVLGLADTDVESLLALHNYYRRLVAVGAGHSTRKVSNMNELVSPSQW